MYKIFIDNNVASEEFVPIAIYDPERIDEGYSASNMSMTKELDRAGSLSFKIPALHPSYRDIYPLRSTIVVLSDDRVVWYGRVISANRDFYMNKSVKCEEAITFFSDILVKPFKYYLGASNYGSTITNHITTIIAMYHNRCSPKRDISYSGGNLPEGFGDSSVYAVKGVDSYTSVWDEISGVCSYDNSVHMTLDYTGISASIAPPTLVIGKMPYAMTENPIEVGVNLIDISDDVDFTDLYTSLIPLDEDNKTMSGSEYYVDNENLKSQYGVIERTIQLGSVSNASLVRNFCNEILQENAKLVIPKISLSALDLFYLTDGSTAIDVGICVHIIAQANGIDGYYLCKSIQVDLENPENANYNFEYYSNIPMS